MNADEKETRLQRKIRIKEHAMEREQKYLRKRSEEDEVLEEVFDKLTLMTLHGLLNRAVIKALHGVISAGKESRVYLAEVPGGDMIAVKIYLIVSAGFKRKRHGYVAFDPRFKKIPRNFRSFVYLWARREYRNLSEAHEAGVICPKPLFIKNNVLGMSFIGREDLRFPMLAEADLSSEEYEKVYKGIIRNVRLLYRRARLVHGDLSQYNILVTDQLRPVLIDLSQAVPVNHPMAHELLRKGVDTLNAFFEREGIQTKDLDDVLKRITGGKHE